MQFKRKNLATARDVSVVTGVAIVAAAVTYAIVDDLTFKRTNKRINEKAARTEATSGYYGDLFSVDTFQAKDATGTYLRPATELESATALRAADIDYGPGVFGVDEHGCHVLPGSGAWTIDLASTFQHRLRYFRVADPYVEDDSLLESTPEDNVEIDAGVANFAAAVDADR